MNQMLFMEEQEELIIRKKERIEEKETIVHKELKMKPSTYHQKKKE